MNGWELVTAAQAGDRDAFAQLYQRYANGVCRVVMARTGDRTLAQDLTSETFLRGLRAIDSVNSQGRDPGAWFSAIARNLTVDHFRSSRHQREQLTAELPDRGSGGGGPEQAVIDKETTAELHHHIAQLPAAQRECLRLRFWEGLSSKETATVMGREERAVRGLRHRAIVGLRAAMLDGDTKPPAAGPRSGPDRLAQARLAVTDVAARVAAADPDTVESDRAERLAGWRSQDLASTRGSDLDRDAAEGVA